MKIENVKLKKKNGGAFYSAILRTCTEGETVQHGPDLLEIKKDGQIHVEIDTKEGHKEFILFETTEDLEGTFSREESSDNLKKANQVLEERLSRLEKKFLRIKSSALKRT